MDVGDSITRMIRGIEGDQVFYPEWPNKLYSS